MTSLQLRMRTKEKDVGILDFFFFKYFWVFSLSQAAGGLLDHHVRPSAPFDLGCGAR